MFVVKKKIHGRDYFYLNETHRENGKVVSKCVAYLGKDKIEAEKKAKEIILERKKDKNISANEKISSGEILKLKSIDELANFCKEKGFVYRSSDIYGGLSGFWDYGPLGIELFNNLKREWWDFFVNYREDMVGMDASIISHPKIWEASGHVANFSDVAVVCKQCKKSSKLDKSEIGKVKCDNCGGEYAVQGEFNLMFKTKIGALDASEAYLRGETAQGMFSDFRIIQQTSRMQLPFGIAQIGRCFRNEIAPRDFLFRSREFHIGEFEFFINPEEKKCDLLDEEHLKVKIKLLDAQTQEKNGESLRDTTIGEILKEGKLEEWHAYWLAEQILWFNSIGLTEMKIREHQKSELSHYSSATFDIDYEYVFGSKEVAGIANRGQFDLTNHEKYSKVSMQTFDEKYKNKLIPKVIEPTFGMERVFLAILSKAYNYDKKKDYVVLKLPVKLAPIKAAIFPIIKKPKYEKIAEDIIKDLRKEWKVSYDKSGSIGRRYARNDEIGTPYCITIDDQTPKDKTVTVRWRDNGEQVRIKIKELKEVLRQTIYDGKNILSYGKKVDTRKKEGGN